MKTPKKKTAENFIKDIRKTVIFSGELKYIAFSPYWNVPQSIVKNELLKDMGRDRQYL